MGRARAGEGAVNFTDLLAAMTWRDVVDFVLLYGIAYAILRLLKGTRAVPVLVSVALLAAAGWVARELDIVGTGLLLRYFLEYVIIILIVGFHQELRRMLVRMGQRFLPGSSHDAAASAVEKLVLGCERLARARIGALFILEGEFDVLQICSDVGKEIDAPLEVETLIALMVPHSINTAHDGAVLIRDFRIDRAGVICPLTEQVLDPRFGTRHRGAIGVSEDSDALVIVLSEERGEIRVAQAGVISEPLDAAGLAEHIEAWIEQPPAGKEEPRAATSQVGAVGAVGAGGAEGPAASHAEGKRPAEVGRA
nr:diadenylate cyclase [Pseudenhygromyxa sp. WMMC2535]